MNEQWLENKQIHWNEHTCITLRFSVEIQSKKIIILLGSTDSEYYFRSEAVIWILSIRNSSLVKTLLHSLRQLLRKLGKYLQPNFSVHWKVVPCKTPSIQPTVAHSKNDAIILKRGLEYLVRWPLRRPPILHNSIDIFQPYFIFLEKPFLYVRIVVNHSYYYFVAVKLLHEVNWSISFSFLFQVQFNQQLFGPNVQALRPNESREKTILEKSRFNKNVWNCDQTTNIVTMAKLMNTFEKIIMKWN